MHGFPWWFDFVFGLLEWGVELFIGFLVLIVVLVYSIRRAKRKKQDSHLTTPATLAEFDKKTSG